MDAYDIFKKLTKGLSFKERFFGTHDNIPTENQIQNAENLIKNEFDDNLTISKCEEELSEDSLVDEDNDLQLTDGVSVTENIKFKKEKSEDLIKALELEEENHFRNENGIKAVGRHIPAALKNFEELTERYNVQQALVDILKQCGYSDPTPIQRQAIPCMLEDRQILACAPTGSGKTAAFILPLLHALGDPRGGPRALILCPTRELAHQIHTEILRLSANSDLRCSEVRNLKESKVKEREATIRKSDILISTPNRICYLLNQDIVNITLNKVEWLIIDEADKLFEGSIDQESDFRQQIDQIMSACDSKERRVALFSATHTPTVAKWSRHNLRGLINITIGQRNAATTLVEQELCFCGNESGKLIAFRQLIQKGLNPPVLIFVQSKDRAKQLFEEMIYDNINVDVIHADRSQAQRDKVVRSFRIGRIWVLICTELMGRGIDFRGVNLVINYDFPPTAISYVHRIGRAGRAGQTGRAITFFTEDDVVNLRSIASVMKQSGCDVPEYMLRLKQNKNQRRRLVNRAPKRDNITTILEKPRKRKLEGADKAKVLSTKDTAAVKGGKYNKQRKIDGVKSPLRKKFTPSVLKMMAEKEKKIKSKIEEYLQKAGRSNAETFFKIKL